MPGMAASSLIFENINLPSEHFEIHLLDWIIPKNNESLCDYAKRLLTKVKHKNPILLGVSFGGILVQEMSKHIVCEKLIIVSSVKSKFELPKRMKFAKVTKAYKLMPTRLMSNIDLLAKYAFGNTITRRIELYKKYLSMNDKRYLDWAIMQVVCWDQEKPIKETIHIHGELDGVFPISNIKDCIVVKGGTHIMIVNKYKWFNENLPKLILN